jgi:hypothetical protein
MKLAGSEIDISRVPLSSGGLVELEAEVWMPNRADGVIICAHGGGVHDGSRIRLMAQVLAEREFGIVLIDPPAGRTLHCIVDQVARHLGPRCLAMGILAIDDAVAAALLAAAQRARTIRALVLCGGRPDISEAVLRLTTTPTLFIAGAENRVAADRAIAQLPEATPRSIQVVGDGAANQEAQLALRWFERCLGGRLNRTAAAGRY